METINGYGINETISFEHRCKRDVPKEKVQADAASTAAFEEAHQLHLAILYQVPQTWRDALVLTAHVSIAMDAGLHDNQDRAEMRAIEMAVEALSVFMLANSDAGPIDGWAGDCLDLNRERTEARTRRKPETQS